MDLFVAICKVILDLFLVIFGLWGLALVNPTARFFIVGLSLMFIWGVILIVLCFQIGTLGYSLSVLSPILGLIIYKIILDKGNKSEL